MRKLFYAVLIKPSKYDDDGYPIVGAVPLYRATRSPVFTALLRISVSDNSLAMSSWLSRRTTRATPGCLSRRSYAGSSEVEVMGLSVSSGCRQTSSAGDGSGASL